MSTQSVLNTPQYIPKSKPQIKSKLPLELLPKNTSNSLAAKEHNSDLVIILVLSSLSGYITSKHVL